MVRKSKHLASISLGIMGAGFISTFLIPPSISSNLLQGGFEGGLVGGLADWFAVTALFRHPLGLPIPHTALVVKNREKITAQLVHMLENDWLSKESILHKLANIEFVRTILDRLSKELLSERAGQRMVAISLALLDAIDVARWAPVIGAEIRGRLYALEVDRFLPKAIDWLIDSDSDIQLLDFLVAKGLTWAKQENTRVTLGTMALQALSNIELDGFMQFAFKSFMGFVNEEKLGTILQNVLIRGLEGFKETDAKARIQVLSYIRTELLQLKENPQLIATCTKWKNSWVDHWDADAAIAELLRSFKEKARLFVQRETYAEEFLAPILQSLINAIRQNADFVNTCEKELHEYISHFIEDHHGKIGTIVLENLNQLDDDTLIQLMEDKLGQDLQWIRVNGAVCGCLIGFLITGFKLVLSAS
ncbi:DUF445 domain-containing protein [Fodinisporobacter ferrooxydans]|uniref:DUF445 domain-containing protein n=1 Tax=Fodinisporobacter ferrooxydans TaxID=2901836 RepID=A0ABY4CJA2_9BACL|nr:DUF445 domain-containing protein [Alicyclobacillaceae bacterium MYW30-H2]